MTNDEWVETVGWQNLYEHVTECRSERKLRLYATATCRWARSLISNRDVYRKGLDASEAVADGALSIECLADARAAAADEMDSDVFASYTEDDALLVMSIYALMNSAPSEGAKQCFCFATDKSISAFREVFGETLGQATFDPRWRTSDVVGLAQAIYDGKAFERMPILADALMDAGCEDAAIIGHCRGDGPHVRGCWVVDLVLDKK